MAIKLISMCRNFNDVRYNILYDNTDKLEDVSRHMTEDYISINFNGLLPVMALQNAIEFEIADNFRMFL
jgi:hypothetical protein